MRKSRSLLIGFSFFCLAFLACFPTTDVVAQCTPSYDEIAGYDLSYQVVNEEEVTRVRFYLDYAAVENLGMYGFQLEVFLTGNIQGVNGVEYAISGSWLLASASATVDVDYDSGSHSVTFEAIRLDCKGTDGDGFIGEVILYRGAGSSNAVYNLSGSLVMVDNLDAA